MRYFAQYMVFFAISFALVIAAIVVLRVNDGFGMSRMARSVITLSMVLVLPLTLPFYIFIFRPPLTGVRSPGFVPGILLGLLLVAIMFGLRVIGG